ncbi:MAG: glycosyltransferase [Phycisphaeraceae bacterium]|nr:MAG: glycosyltransferase [Phycisphaeraceae bacterium]
MRILMLGWEFPPYMAGGLGTACFGLTRAISRAGHHVTFVMPKAVGRGGAEFVELLGPDSLRPMLGSGGTAPRPGASGVVQQTVRELIESEAGHIEGIDLERTSILRVPAGFSSSYGAGDAVDATKEALRLKALISILRERGIDIPLDVADAADRAAALPLPSGAASELNSLLDSADRLCQNTAEYGKDLFGDADRYARVVAAMSSSLDFDVIHAHDWLAFPAGMAVRAVTGKPLVCQVHATEFDRSGDHINQHVYDIERAGVHAADHVIAVSRLTKEILTHRYGVGSEKVDVVYNGVDANGGHPELGGKIESDDKIVLFLGRITMQKGPEYFIRAAARVLEKFEKVKFVVAGSGDMALRMIEEAAHLGIGHKVLFTGFLRGKDVERIYRMADCYVMPSVSEPFGIVALEAVQHDTPTIISKQSGVSEVLSHALKVDFWDINDMADKILAVLRYPPLSQTLRQHGPFELRRLTWADAARKAIAAYGRAIATHAGM